MPNYFSLRTTTQNIKRKLLLHNVVPELLEHCGEKSILAVPLHIPDRTQDTSKLTATPHTKHILPTSYHEIFEQRLGKSPVKFKKLALQLILLDCTGVCNIIGQTKIWHGASRALPQTPGHVQGTAHGRTGSHAQQGWVLTWLTA